MGIKLTPQEIKLFRENDILQARTWMYYILALFLGGTSLAAYLISILLFIFLMIVLVAIWLFLDPGLLSLIIKYVVEKYLHIIP